MPRPFLYRTVALAVATAAIIAATSPHGSGVVAADTKAPDPAAVERARATVKLIDDLHKGYVVTITDTYVKAQESTPAATVAKKVFAHMEKSGHGTGRLIDVSGQPIREGNVAKSDFEKRAAKEIKSGKAYLDEVAEKDGKPVLRAATVVPAVMAACVNCHPHVKKGEVLGALVYEIPIR
ncbi:MAG TPA: DUF3365 domain-containing protein [Gemmata sp.]|nr:DUF3365 domain-containing protein [Gemmata sp.]